MQSEKIKKENSMFDSPAYKLASLGKNSLSGEAINIERVSISLQPEMFDI